MFSILLWSHLAFFGTSRHIKSHGEYSTLHSLRRVFKQKTEMYTTWQIGWLPVQGTWLGYVSQSVTWGSMWPTGQTSNNYPTN